MKLSEYVRYDALGLAALVAKRDVSAAELQAAALAAIDAVNPRINAVVEHWPAETSGAAGPGTGGAFAGVPFLIKDVAITMAGKRVELGSRIAAGHVAAADST